MLREPKIALMIRERRKAMSAQAVEDFILNRDEIRRRLTEVVLTPIGDLDETSDLVQEVSYEYATNPITGEPIYGPNGKQVRIKMKVKMIGKMDSIRELNKMDGHYDAEKKEPEKELPFGREAALKAFENDPAFQEALRYEAKLHIALGGKIHDAPFEELPRVEMTQQEKDAADAEEDAFIDRWGRGGDDL